MQENFDIAITALIENEGKYSNNPADPGGETMYGITKRVAVKHGYAGDMHDLPLDLAKSIAKSEYWDACGCDELADRLDFQVFDASYNSGPERALEWFNKAWDTSVSVMPGGIDRVIMRFDAYRLLFLYSLPTWPNFGRGWCKRIAKNLLRAAA